MHEFHLDCSVCGTLLDCDNLSISLDEYELCDEREYSRHVPRQVKCTLLDSLLCSVGSIVIKDKGRND